MLGCYYLTKEKKGTKGEGRAFASMEDVIIALEHGEVETLTPIRLMYTGELIDLTTVYDDQDVIHTEVQNVKNQVINTTVGRVILNDHLPKGLPFVNGLLAQEGPAGAGAVRLPALRPREDGRDAGRHQGPGLPLRHPRRHLHRHRRPVIPEVKEQAGGRRAEGSAGRREAVPGRRHHQRRALQQGHRHLVDRHREGGGRHVQGDGDSRTARAASSTRSTSWRTRAPADPSSRSASWPACAA